jgi:Ca2+-binding EF-hand superfamily protein
MTEDQIDEEQELLDEEIEVLQAEITKFNSQAGKKIHPADLNEKLKRLGKRMSKKEIEEMIWEVDEDLDGCVNWNEFKLMFLRNICDTTGMEPYSMFNVVQFMMYDKDASGSVTVDETMSMLYARYGRDQLEQQMKELFGEDLQTADGAGRLNFEEYLRAVRVRIIQEPTVSNPMPVKVKGSKSKKR